MKYLGHKIEVEKYEDSYMRREYVGDGGVVYITRRIYYINGRLISRLFDLNGCKDYIRRKVYKNEIKKLKKQLKVLNPKIKILNKAQQRLISKLGKLGVFL